MNTKSADKIFPVLFVFVFIIGMAGMPNTRVIAQSPLPELTLEKSALPATYSQTGDVINYSYLLTNTGSGTLSGPFSITDDKTTATCSGNVPPASLNGTVLFDHFENSNLAQHVSGMPVYVGGPNGFGDAIDFSSGAWLRYNVPGWYEWPSTYDPAGKSGSVDLWVYPRKYNIGLVNFNWSDTNTPPGAGHILHLTINPEGKLHSGTWSAISGPELIQLPSGNTTIPLNQWTHVAYTWDAGGTRLFVNGVQDAFSPDNLYPALESTFYAYVPYWGEPGMGYIDELRITSSSQTNFGTLNLAPTETTTCTASYKIAQSDVDNSSVSNTAQAHGFFGTTPVDSNQDTATVTFAQQPPVANPWLEIWYPEDRVQVVDWPLNTSVSLTIDNDFNVSNGVLYQHNYDRGNQDRIDIELAGIIDIQPGQIITVSDAQYTRFHQVTNLTVTGWNIEEDKVFGTAKPNSPLQIHARNPDTDWAWRNITADSYGNWVFDFSQPGVNPGDQGLLDIKPGTWGAATQWGSLPNEGGETHYAFYIYNPNFSVWLNQNKVDGYGWPENAQVTLTVGNPLSPDYQMTETVGNVSSDLGSQGIRFEFGNNFQLQNGQTITLTSSNYVRTHTITQLIVTSINAETNMVTGTAAPGSDVRIENKWNNQIWRHEVTAPNGTWTADFNIAGDETGEIVADINPGEEFHVGQNDTNGNGTWWYLPIPSGPAFGVRVVDDEIEGWWWLEGATVTITIEDTTTTKSPDYYGTDVVDEVFPGNDHRFRLRLHGQFDIVPGQIVTVKEGVTTKQTVVTGFEVKGIDVDTDIVSGIAQANSLVHLWICTDSWCANRHVFADTSGAWHADFSVPGIGGDEQQLFDIVPGTHGDSAQWDDDGDGTSYFFQAYNPFVEASPTSDWVHAREWPTGTVLTLTIDDPSSGVGVDYTTTATMGQAPWNPGDPNDIVADFNLQGYEIHANQVVSVTDGSTTKTLTVAWLQGVTFDIAADTISGTGTSGGQVQVCANVPNRCITRYVTPNGSGNWTANYAVAGVSPDDPDTFNVQPGSNGWAAEYEADSDRTWVDWNVPNPRFDAWYRDGYISAYDWPLGTLLTLEIEDSSTPKSPDYSTTTVVGIASWDPNQTQGEFRLNGVFEIQPGMTLTISGGASTKELVVSNLTITSVNQDTEIVNGSTEPNQMMWMHYDNSSGTCCRELQADSNGIWSVDYSQPGANGEQVEDIRPGSSGTINARDADGDNTSFSWNVLNPRMEVMEYADRIALIDWPAGQTVHVSIGNVSSPDYEQDFTPFQDQSYYEFFTTYDIKTGDIVTASNGVVTKTLEVAVLQATEINPNNGIVSGVAAPNSQFDVEVHGDHFDVSPVWYVVSVDGNGNWSADYSDIPGSLLPWKWFISGWMRQSDADGDVTLANWHNHWSVLEVLMNEAQLGAYDWPLGATLTFTVDDPTTYQPVDFTKQAQTVPLTWLDHGSAVVFVEGSFKLQPGMIVTVTDGTTTKSTVIQNTGFTQIDAVHNIIRGHAPANASLDIVIPKDYGSQRYITADANGEWIVDYNTPDVAGRTLDLEPGDQIQGLYMRDAEFDSTVISGYVPNPAFGARPGDDRVEGWQWQLGAAVTVEIDDPATTNTVVDYTGQTDVYLPDWNPNETRFDLSLNGEYDLKPGDIVTVTDGFTTKTLVVTDFALGEINLGTDMVFGHAGPNSQINVWACDNTRCANREEKANQAGNWQSNFSIPGELDWEQDTIDIKAGTWVDSSQNDEDGDGTYSGRNAGSTITGTAYLINIAPENRVAGVMVEACNADNFCRTGLTDGSGNYWISGLPAGTYNLRGIPPGTNLPGSLGPIVISYDEILYGQDITVPAPPLPPPPHAIEPAHTGGGTVAVYWMDDLTLTTTGCINGTAAFELTALEDGYTISGEMTETPTGSGTYKATIPPLYPHHGVTEIVYTVNCPNGDTVETPFFIYIDPSGVVKNTLGVLIPNATVTLLYADNPDGPFTEVPNDGTMMSPSNRNNPDITNAKGEFGWDVVAGFYKVRVEKAGCFSPTDPTQSFVESTVLTIPPPVTGLELTLKCSSLPPIASAGGPYSINEGDTATLDASASSDPEAGALTYAWDLDYNGQYNDATGVKTMKTFTDNGPFTVGLRVTDPDNLSATAIAEITVANVSPIVNIQQASANSLGILTGNGSFVDPGTDTWTATVNYGDNTGTKNLTLNPDKSFALSHAYPVRNGTYTVKVCVSDDDSGSSCNQTQVTVKYNRPPVAEADGPYFANEGSNITLNASRSTDPDKNIVLYEWDLDNDGQFDDATGVKPKVTFPDNGVYKVFVRVTDAGGLSSVDSSTVNVKNVPPVITSLSFSSPVRVGVKVNANATFKDVGVNDTFTAIWKWGDGTSTSGVISAHTVTGSHTYAKPGIYLVTIIVKDKDGGINQTSKLIVVLPKK